MKDMSLECFQISVDLSVQISLVDLLIFTTLREDIFIPNQWIYEIRIFLIPIITFHVTI